MAESSASTSFARPSYVRGTPGHVLEGRYFYYEVDPDCTVDLAVVWGGYERCAADFEIRRQTYPYHVVKYTVAGRGTLTMNSQVLPLHGGILSGFSPGTPHHYRCDREHPMEHYFVAFGGRLAPTLMAQSLPAERGAAPAMSPAQAQQIFETILRKGTEKREHSQALCCSYLRILLLEQATAMAQADRPSPQSLQTYRRCKKYIDDNFSCIASVQEIADACDVNVRYLSRLFRQYNSITPHEYIARLKMNKAASLLLATNLSVRQIARQLGFDDPYHFSRNFKRIHGLSPHHYRSSHLPGSL